MQLPCLLFLVSLLVVLSYAADQTTYAALWHDAGALT